MIQFFIIFAILFTTVFSQTTPSSSEPECLNPNLLMTPNLRKEVLDYVNDVRNTLKNGQLLLENGEYALVPESMPELEWSCDFEEEMHEYGNEFCNTQMLPSQNWTWFVGTYDYDHANVQTEGRHKLKNGQLTLQSGEHPLIPLNMPDLSWSCEDEEDLYQITKDICRSGIWPLENFTWSLSQYNQPHASIVNSGLIYFDFFGYSHNYLSQHIIFTGSAPLNTISAIHDKAETVACALYDCIKDDENNDNADIALPGLPPSATTNYLYCKITPDVQFGEKIYEVSPADMTNFPSQDVICPHLYGNDIEFREMILQKINAVRQQIQQGTLLLENGYHA